LGFDEKTLASWLHPWWSCQKAPLLIYTTCCLSHAIIFSMNCIRCVLASFVGVR
jgi:hypothetical protein